MHDTALAAAAAFFAAYHPPHAPAPRVLDLGSMNVNGSFRDHAPAGSDYVGVDIEAGPGVDVVIRPGEALPFPDGGFDSCISGNCFEHDASFWDSFGEMLRVVRPGGFVMVQTLSNGPYHAFPQDCWRFYPDAGLALEQWARRRGHPVTLLESGILRQRTDIWNDFVAVWQKAGAAEPRAAWLMDAFPDAMNIRRADREGLGNPEITPQDLTRSNEALSALEARHAAALCDLRQREEEIAALRASTSWRVTAPLRGIARRLRG